MMTDLLTLTGPGGSGKTRLALEVVRELTGAYQDGVWLVELAPLTDPALVLEAVTRVLGTNERPGGSAVEALLEHLRDKKLLLLLDNCEHLVDEAARLVEKLTAVVQTLKSWLPAGKP